MTYEVWIDGSRWQGVPAFPALRASGVVGVIWNVDDPSFLARIHEAAAAGLKLASYHYTDTGVGSPQAAAQHHLTQIASVKSSLTFVAGDHESGTGDLTDWTYAYQDALSAGFGQTAWFYTGGWWTAQHIRFNAVELRRFPLWDAAYVLSEPNPPAPWQSIAMWQHTSSAQRPGISGNVDEDFYYATDTPTPTPIPLVTDEEPEMLIYEVPAPGQPETAVYINGAAGKRHLAPREYAAWQRKLEKPGDPREEMLASELATIPDVPSQVTGPQGPPGPPGADRIVRVQGGPQ